MNKLISILLLCCLAIFPVYAHAIIVGYGNSPAGGGEFTSFTDDFTGSNGASLNSTHWNTSSATIQSNRAMFTIFSSTMTAQGKEDITLKATHSFKVDIDNSQAPSFIIDTSYVSGIITVQDSASVGTTHNKVYAELRYDCTDGDGFSCYSSTMVVNLVSTSNDGTPTTLWSGSCNYSETGVEIRFDNSLTKVRLYINGTPKGTDSSSITASLGSTVKVAMAGTGVNYTTIQVYFDNMNVSVL